MIFEAARLAPSAANRQPWRFVVVQDGKRKKALATAANSQTFLSDAAAIVAAISDPEVSANWYERDPMIASEHMALAAAALGYGTCWIGAFDEDAVKNLLKIDPKGCESSPCYPSAYLMKHQLPDQGKSLRRSSSKKSGKHRSTYDLGIA